MGKTKQMKRVAKGKGIKAKLMLGLIPLVTISLVAVILTAHSMAKNSLMEKEAEVLQLTGNAASNKISGWLSECVSGMETITYTIEKNKMDEPETRAYLETILGADENFPDGMYMAAEDGTLVDGSGWVPETDPRETEWYKQGQEHEAFFFIEPYIDDLTGQYVVTAVKKAVMAGKKYNDGLRYPSGNGYRCYYADSGRRNRRCLFGRWKERYDSGT